MLNWACLCLPGTLELFCERGGGIPGKGGGVVGITHRFKILVLNPFSENLSVNLLIKTID